MNRLATPALLIAVLLVAAAPEPAAPRAGEVRHVVPQGWLLRGAAEAKAAVRADAVHLGDRLRTDRGGRARVGLDDGSVVNVGSESELTIAAHDPAAQRTALELGYGRIRASVVRLAQPAARFEVRTPAATAGVIGTRFAVRAAGDAAEVFCLEGEVAVRSSDPVVGGEVRLRAGQFTRVLRGRAPAPAAEATPEQLREIEEETSLEAPGAAPAFTRVELSWPPAGCGESFALPVRAWVRGEGAGKPAEVPADPETVTGWLALDERRVWVEGGRAYLTGAGDAPPLSASFTPAGAAAPVAARVWPPLELEAGQGWRAPRAALAGNAFYVLGPMERAPGAAGFRFGAQPAELLWSGPCGAAFLAPAMAGGEYEVELTAGGRAVARGRMNIVEIGYQVPTPPAIKRGQTAAFGVRYRGLENLAAHTAGRPVLRSRLRNVSPDVIGDLATRTPGAAATGETIQFAIGPAAIAPDGSARLDATARGRRAGSYRLDVDHTLDEALRRPRTPLTPASPSATADATRP